MELQKELLQKANNKEAYDEIAEQIFKLREQRQQCTVDTAARDAQIARITELQDFINEQAYQPRWIRWSVGETLAETNHHLGRPLHSGA